MFSEYESASHEKQATAILAALGKFVISFERVCAGMRACICARRKQGDSQQSIVYGKSAESLRLTLGKQYKKVRTFHDAEDRRCVDSLLDRIKRLCETRNRLLHSEWHMNFNYDNASEEFVALAVHHDINNTDGAFITSVDVSLQTLNDYILDATQIQVLLGRLAICLSQRGFKVSSMFLRPLSIGQPTIA